MPSLYILICQPFGGQEDSNVPRYGGSVTPHCIFVWLGIWYIWTLFSAQYFVYHERHGNLVVCIVEQGDVNMSGSSALALSGLVDEYEEKALQN